MAGFPERRRWLVDASFATFGEDAEWPDLGTVRVRFKTTDVDSRFGGVDLVERSTMIRVRSWEVWARRDQLKRPICITLLSLIAAIGVVSTR
jgi:hypothetical protein